MVLRNVPGFDCAWPLPDPVMFHCIDFPVYSRVISGELSTIGDEVDDQVDSIRFIGLFRESVTHEMLRVFCL